MSTKDTLELLEEFRVTGSQAPFEEIARRYAGMVYNVAVQVTKDAHDAEDATQATFLTLAVHAKTDSSIRYLGPWLRKVSHRLALDIRRSKKRRKAREEKHANGDDRLINGYNVPVSKDLQQEELRNILRDELEKLPAKYRMPLVLYYFGGLTPEEMGKELKVNTSTLGVRLHRGRKLLADSLSLRGISINTAALSVLLAGLVDRFVQERLVHLSTSAAFHSGAVAAYGGPAPFQVANLITATRSAITFARAKMILGLLIVVTSTLAGGAEILKKLDLLPSSLKINLGDWLKPMIDKLHFGLPTATIASSNLESATPHQHVATVESFTLIQNAGVAVTLPAERDRQALASNGLIGFVVQKPQPAPAAVTRIGLDSNSNKVATAQPVRTFSLQSASKATATPVRSLASVDVDTTIDGAAGSAAAMGSLASGVYKANRFVVGDVADGSFNQTGGEVRATEGITLGRGVTGVGKYSLSGGSVLASNITVGDAGKGEFTQNSGLVAGLEPGGAVKTLSLGAQATGVGEYALNGGTLAVDQLVIGDAGAGTLTQSGGTAVVSFSTLGNAITGSGTWSISGGMIQLASSASGKVSGIVVGNNGLGSLLVRPKGNGVAISETATNIHAGLTVRANQTSDGILRGWGDIGLTGQVVQNGRVVADGGGLHHLLDLSSVSGIVNTIDNVANGGSNGWYARSGGQLKLPATALVENTPSTWGEDPTDPSIDLVNSARFTPHALAGAGTLSMTLLDAKDSGAPKLPLNETALSIYSVASTTNAGSVDWTFRVDDAQAALLAMDESKLTVLYYENGWQTLSADAVTHDLVNHLVGGTTLGLPKYVAVGEATGFSYGVSPEPGSMLLLSAGAVGAGLIRRRRRD